MSLISALTTAIERGQVLPAEMFHQRDIGAILDSRDEPAFETEWLRVNDALTDLARAESPAAHRLREVAFKATYAASQDPDLSAYVSDDFGLIGAALDAGFEDEWLNALWRAYAGHDIPHSRLAGAPGSLSRLIQQFIDKP